MEPKTVETFTATIWVGLKNRATGEVVDSELVRKCIQDYVDGLGFCVSLTRTEFLYTNGAEPGFAIGIINYPRFPSTTQKLVEQALDLAERVRIVAQQLKVSVVFPDQTVMLFGEEPL